MTETPPFQKYPKTPRLFRDVVITEKIDGTNGLLQFGTAGDLLVGSRNRWITPGEDNHAFAAWAYEHQEALFEALGPGRFHGEWYGPGIQGNPLNVPERRFALFNTSLELDNWVEGLEFVPVLYTGPFYTRQVTRLVDAVRAGTYVPRGTGPGEGVIVYHTASNQLFKVLCENDELPKGAQ